MTSDALDAVGVPITKPWVTSDEGFSLLNAFGLGIGSAYLFPDGGSTGGVPNMLGQWSRSQSATGLINSIPTILNKDKKPQQ